MQSLTHAICLIYCGIALVFCVHGALLAGRRIPPNRITGLRTEKTLGSPDVWYPANAYAGRCLIAAGIVQLVLVVALYFIPSVRASGLGYVYTVLGVMVTTLLISLTLSFRYLSKL